MDAGSATPSTPPSLNSSDLVSVPTTPASSQAHKHMHLPHLPRMHLFSSSRGQSSSSSSSSPAAAAAAAAVLSDARTLPPAITEVEDEDDQDSDIDGDGEDGDGGGGGAENCRQDRHEEKEQEQEQEEKDGADAASDDLSETAISRDASQQPQLQVEHVPLERLDDVGDDAGNEMQDLSQSSQSSLSVFDMSREASDGEAPAADADVVFAVIQNRSSRALLRSCLHRDAFLRFVIQLSAASVHAFQAVGQSHTHSLFDSIRPTHSFTHSLAHTNFAPSHTCDSLH